MVSDGALRASSTLAAQRDCEVITCGLLLRALQRSLDYFRSPVQGILQEETCLDRITVALMTEETRCLCRCGTEVVGVFGDCSGGCSLLNSPCLAVAS